MIDLQHKLGVHVSGAVPPRPVTSFGHFGFDDTLLKAIRRSDFTQPTPIQAEYWKITHDFRSISDILTMQIDNLTIKFL